MHKDSVICSGKACERPQSGIFYDETFVASQELICSGGIHAGLIVSQTCGGPEQLTFYNEMFSAKNDNLIIEGPASEIMGEPLHSLRWLVGSLMARGSGLQKGSLVIPGSPVELVTIDKDTELTVEVEDVGVLTANFRKEHQV